MRHLLQAREAVLLSGGKKLPLSSKMVQGDLGVQGSQYHLPQ